MEWIREASPRFRARMAGVFWILMAVMGGLAQFARRGILISGDAAATATNIMAHESSYLLGFAGDLLLVASYVAVVALFYRMLKPVNRSVSLTAAFFGLMGCTIQAAAAVFELAPLVVLGRAQYLSVFKMEQLQALAYMFLKFYSQGYAIALVFFGFFMLLTGYLVFKSTFLPRILGVLWMVAGLSSLTFLSPPFGAKYLYPYILSGDIGEVLLALWLVVKGVDEERWKEQAGAAGG